MFFTPTSPLCRAVDVIDRLDRRLRTGRDRLRRRSRHRDDRHGSTRVDHVADPDGSTRLVRVSGLLTADVMPCLVRSWDGMRASEFLHIDLTDAPIVDLTTMLALERAVDHLERQGVDIRIVGIDPAHPALTALSA